jgi:hypothetical protein
MAKKKRQSTGGSFASSSGVSKLMSNQDNLNRGTRRGGTYGKQDSIDYTKVKPRSNDGMANEPFASIPKQRNQGNTQQISDPDSVHTYGKNFRNTITASARSRARKGAIKKAYI